MPYLDLHMHSLYSDDGEFTPAQLVQQCHEAGIAVMAVTDHNCARANAEARTVAEAQGLTYVDAIEIDCTFEGVNLHLLGYGIDSNDPAFAAIEQSVATQGAQASQKMLHAAHAMGFAVTEAQMQRHAVKLPRPECWTGELFAEVLLTSAENQGNPLLDPYRTGGARSDNPYVNFYWDFCAQGKPCHVPIVYPSLAQTVQLVRKNHGLAVLAHPGANLRGRDPLLMQIIESGLDGLEAFSSYHSPEQAAFYHKTAQETGLLTTCGSDYHGKIKPAIRLGQTGCTVDDRLLWQRFSERLAR